MMKPTDPEILGRILVLQSSLQAAPDTKKLGELVCYALSNLPGISSTAFYREQQLVAQFSGEPELSHEWGISWQTEHELFTTDSAQFTFLTLQTNNAVYGYIALSLSAAEIFQAYIPHLENTANLIALMLENRIQDAALRSINANLEEQVKTRVTSLHESEERLSLALQATRSGIWDWNVKTGKVYFDANYFTLAGYEPDEFPHAYEEWEKRVHPEDVEKAKEAINLYLAGKSDAYAVEFRFRTKGNSWMWILSQGNVTERDKRGNPIRFVGAHTDISERKRAEEDMALMTFALDSIHEAAYLIDENARIRYVNRESCRALNYTRAELTALGVSDIGPTFPIALWPEHWQELKEHGVLNLESVHRTKDGRDFPVAISANYFEFNGTGYNLALARDLTEHKRFEEERVNLERQFLQAQKLESLGILAGGIAHDFNNLLAAIIGNVELGKRRISPESAALDNLKRIEQAAESAADLAKQMLAYSGKGKFVVENIDLNRLLEEMLHILEVSISKKVVLRLNPYEALPTVEVDTAQMRQIIMNLVINASEAIGAKSGVVSITTGCMTCDRSYLHDVWLDENLTDGLYVYLEIADTGCGMEREILDKLFDPFFTTKFTGRGLGMAAVLGIVRGHKGAIKVYSEPGRGTTFKILLPASAESAVFIDRELLADDWLGTGLVLLVDDEETIRATGSEMLKELGFTTLTAEDGRDALEKFKANPAIAFVILDLTMPHMDGEECFRALRKLNPAVRVIMSSGYNEQEVTQKFAGKGLAGFIQKPYKLSVLQEAVRKAL